MGKKQQSIKSDSICIRNNELDMTAEELAGVLDSVFDFDVDPECGIKRLTLETIATILFFTAPEIIGYNKALVMLPALIRKRTHAGLLLMNGISSIPAIPARLKLFGAGKRAQNEN